MTLQSKQYKGLCKHMLAWALAAAMLLNLLPAAAFSQARASDSPPAQGLAVEPPLIKSDASMRESGQLVTWDCIWLGSYPQTEVEASDLPQTVTWDENGDGHVYGMKKYRRISKADTTHSNYWPQDAGEYRYFKYEPIKWRVLSVDNEKDTAFCLADVGLDCQRYNQVGADIIWETSTIRTWLNGSSEDSSQAQDNNGSKSFINKAFTTDEKAAIVKTNVVNKNNLNPKWNINGGNNTEDHIFLLSESEVYGDSTAGNATSYGFAADPDIFDEARRCTATAFAHAMGAWTYTYGSYGKDHCYWWLRSPGGRAGWAAFVKHEGYVDRGGGNVGDYYVAVRPALNLDLSSDVLQYAGTVASNGEVEEIPYEQPNPTITTDISPAELQLEATYAYTGEAIEPKPLVKLGELVLTEGTDYTLSYENNIEVGTAKLFVIGCGDYEGEASSDFQIAKDLSAATLYMRTKFTYNGKAHTPKPVVVLGKSVLTEGEDYMLSYKNNVKKGTATVIVSGIGAYMGAARANFTIAYSHDYCFQDVDTAEWYHEVIHRSKDLGLIQGTGDGSKFAPKNNITRGQIAVILHRMAGSPKASATKKFPDVPSDAYYAKAVAWAESKGVASGYGNGKFGPSDNVTRQQLATMLRNYAMNIANKEPKGSKANYSKMNDKADVAGWAEEAVGWCFKEGILTGTKNTNLIQPKHTATRAAAAKMVLGLYDYINE